MPFASPVGFLVLFGFSLLAVFPLWWPLTAWEPWCSFLNQKRYIQQNRRHLAINWLWRDLKLSGCLREILYFPRTLTSCCALKIYRKRTIWEILIKGPRADVAWVMGFVPVHYVQNSKLEITYDFCHCPFNENYSVWLWTQILLSKLRRVSSLYTWIPITVEK